MFSAAVHAVAAVVLLVWGLNGNTTSLGGSLRLSLEPRELTETAEEEQPTPAYPETPPVEAVREPVLEVVEVVEVAESLPEALEPLDAREPARLIGLPLRVTAHRTDEPELTPTAPPQARPLHSPPPSVASAPRRSVSVREGPLRPLSMPTYYPAEALRGGVAGTVLIEIVISTDGTVADARIVRTSGSRTLDRAAVDSARRWRFVPISAARRAHVPVRYVLGGGVRAG